MWLRTILERRRKFDPAKHTTTDEHGLKWVTQEFFGFGNLSRSRDLELDLPSAEEYLTRFGDQFPWRDFWLEHGRTFLSPTRRQCRRMKYRLGAMWGNCYINALELALGKRGRIVLPHHPNEVLYGEGLAVHPTGAWPHGWLVVDGKIYDPTWPDAYRASYFGITMDPKWMLEFAETFNKVSLCQNWEFAKPRLEAYFGEEAESA